MNTTAVAPTPAKAQMWRRWVIKGGKHFLLWMGCFQARHSLVSIAPVIPNTEFARVPHARR